LDLLITFDHRICIIDVEQPAQVCSWRPLLFTSPVIFQSQTFVQDVFPVRLPDASLSIPIWASS
jgi:hypothetical protein